MNLQKTSVIVVAAAFGVAVFQNCSPMKSEKPADGLEFAPASAAKTPLYPGVDPAQVIFQESFPATRLDAAKWNLEGYAKHASFVAPVPGNYALRLAGDGAYANGIRSKWPFVRGGKLTVTFRVWHSPTLQYLTLGGPWQAVASTRAQAGNYPYLNNVESGFSGQDSGGADSIKWAEGSPLWGGVVLDADFKAAWRNARSRSTSLVLQVELGDQRGAVARWSRDGKTFQPLRTEKGAVIDTRGGSNPYSGDDGRISDKKTLWLAFGGSHSQPLYLDDIEVTRAPEIFDNGRILAEARDVDLNSLLPSFQTEAEANAIAPTGWEYDDVIPDTLDLAERAALAINGLTESRDMNNCHQTPRICGFAYLSVYFAESDPEKRYVPGGLYTHKFARALPLLRSASGSRQNLIADAHFMKQWLIAAKGLVTYPYSSYTPNEPGTALAMYNWYHKDFNPDWLKMTRLVAEASEREPLLSGNKIFIPAEAGRDQATGAWVLYDQAGAPIPYYLAAESGRPVEPWLDQIGVEGSVKWNQAFHLRSGVRNWVETGREASRVYATGIKYFLVQEALWDRDPGSGCITRPPERNESWSDYCVSYQNQENAYQPATYPGHLFGIWSGQSHGGLTGLAALLNYSLATGDTSVHPLIRGGLDHAIRAGIPELGWVPYWIGRGSWGRPEYNSDFAETGALGDLVVLGVMVSDAGLGDYWDQVDRTVQNALAEAQITDAAQVAGLSGVPLAEARKSVGRMLYGAYPSYGDVVSPGDMSANGAIGFAYAWDATMRYQNGVVRVNLPFNKAAVYGDFYSELPYRGVMTYKNKWATEARIRIPGFVAEPASAVAVFVNGVRQTSLLWEGRYVVVKNLGPGARVDINFPMTDKVATFRLSGVEYTARIRGHTVLTLTPGAAELADRPTHNQHPSARAAGIHKKYPFYRRAQYVNNTGGGEIPRRTVRRFVTDRRIPLQHENYVGYFK